MPRAEKAPSKWEDGGNASSLVSMWLDVPGITNADRFASRVAAVTINATNNCLDASQPARYDRGRPGNTLCQRSMTETSKASMAPSRRTSATALTAVIAAVNLPCATRWTVLASQMSVRIA